jgi:hypothetical protein
MFALDLIIPEMKRERCRSLLTFSLGWGWKIGGCALNQYTSTMCACAASRGSSSRNGSGSVAFCAFKECAVSNNRSGGFLDFYLGNRLPKPHAETFSFFV